MDVEYRQASLKGKPNKKNRFVFDEDLQMENLNVNLFQIIDLVWFCFAFI